MPNLTRRNFLRWAAASAVAGTTAFLASCARSKKKTINFLNWSGYIGKETLAKFEQESGIAVNYEVYSNEDEMLKKLKVGIEGYDLVVASDHMIPKLRNLKLLAPTPQDRLKNLGNIARRFRDPFFDPGLAYTVPYLWGTTGLGFSTTRFPKPPDSWRALWEERYKGRISMLDNVYDVIGCALLLLGLPTDSKNPVHLQKVRQLLLRQRPLLKQYTSYIDDLATGELWLAQGWSGDILRISQENKLVDYAIPQEGSFIWRDNLCLSRGAGDQKEALQFMDFLLRPDVAAEIANTVRYATPNEKAMPLLDAALREDARVFPPREVEKRLRFSATLDPEADELWHQVWLEVKTA